MAKKSKKAKKVTGKGKGKNKARKNSGPRVKDLSPEERSKRSAIGRTAFLMHTTTGTNESIQKQILKEFPDASDGHQSGNYQTIIRSRLQRGNSEFAWLTAASHKGDSYFDHGPDKKEKKTSGKKVSKKKTPKAKKSAKARKTVSG